MKFPVFNLKRSLATKFLMLLTCVLTLSAFGTAQSFWGTRTGQKSATDASDNVVLAPQAESLFQCANGGRGSTELPCSGSNWQFGNLGRNNSQWVEGEYVPYRALLTGLTVGSTGNTLIINYATTENGKHAIDYLGTWDQSTLPPNGPGGADACVNVSPCSPPSTAPIPLDPTLTAANPGIQATGQNFTIWNGTITNVSAYTITGDTLPYGGTSQTSITITFTANASDVVIAWGGHISTRLDWTIAGSAISISGSPYHTNINNGANRSLSVAATIYPALLRIIKEVTTLGPPLGSTSTFSFNFTFTQGATVTPFALVDDVPGPGPGSPVSTNATETFPIVAFDAANTITVVEQSYAPTWTLIGNSCQEDPGGLPQTDDSTINLATRTATIIPQEAEIIQCTFANSQLQPTAAPATISGRATDSFGNGIGGARITLMNGESGEIHSALTNPFGYYELDGAEVGNFYVMTISHKRYTFADDMRMFSVHDNLAGVDFVANP